MRIPAGTTYLAISLIALTAMATIQVTVQMAITISAPGVPHFDYLLSILFENQGLNQTVGPQCTGYCTYITSLAQTYGLAKDYSAIGHPSLPNYLALTSGGNYDSYPFDLDCSPHILTACHVSAPNVIGSVENSGRTWKAYMEDYTGGGCTGSGDSFYAGDHNPFVYYKDINDSAARCANIVNANPGRSGYLALPTLLLSDLNSATTSSSYMWLSPNVCDDGHTVCNPLNNGVSQANQYLSLLVPKILSSTLFTTQREPLPCRRSGSVGGRRLVFRAESRPCKRARQPTAKTAYTSLIEYSHYSTVRTIETAWNLPTLTSYDSSTNSMTEFFGP